jgi:hypothetical protein
LQHQKGNIALQKIKTIMRETVIVKQNSVQFRRPNTNVNSAIKSDVILGSPSARCNGVGICRVMGIGAFPTASCPRVNAILSVTPGGDVRFSFQKSDLTPEQMKTHFQWGFFSVVEPYRVSARICKQINWKSGWIYPGTYQVWETGSTLTVVFSKKRAQLTD